MSLARQNHDVELLRFIHGYQLANSGILPSFQECADARRTSKSLVSEALDRLERRGLARRLKCRARAIEVLVPPAVPVVAEQPLYAVPGFWSARP